MAFAYDGAWAEYTVAQAVGLTWVPDNVPLEQAAILADAVSTPFGAVPVIAVDINPAVLDRALEKLERQEGRRRRHRRRAGSGADRRHQDVPRRSGDGDDPCSHSGKACR